MSTKDQSPNYPTPQKNQEVPCLGCGGKGVVYDRSKGSRTCKGCKGKGVINA